MPAIKRRLRRVRITADMIYEIRFAWVEDQGITVSELAARHGLPFKFVQAVLLGNSDTAPRWCCQVTNELNVALEIDRGPSMHGAGYRRWYGAQYQARRIAFRDGIWVVKGTKQPARAPGVS